MDLLISVVIPTYRRADMLAELLAALLPQCTAQPVEVLVVDNCPENSARDQISALQAEAPDIALRYVHAPQPGVVHARNCGVAAALAPYVLFIDDDEVPAEGWLAAFVGHARAGVGLAFGRIVARYEHPPGADLETMLSYLFSRDLDLPDGADASSRYIQLGTGNALFHKDRCLSETPPFDPGFNRSGGEDLWLISRLVEAGEKPVWVPDGVVEELVPAARMTLDHMKERRYNQGRLRCIYLAQRGAWGRALIWTAVGGVQTVGHRIASRIGPAGQRSHHLAQAEGGLGKLLWWRGERASYYME